MLQNSFYGVFLFRTEGKITDHLAQQAGGKKLDTQNHRQNTHSEERAGANRLNLGQAQGSQQPPTC